MVFNLLIHALAALVPLVVGFVWYNPKVLGNAWMKATGLSMDDAKSVNMPLVFGVSLLVSFLLSVSLNAVVIHQNGMYSALNGVKDVEDATTPIGGAVKTIMDLYGKNYRTFGHGALHGALMALFMVMPTIVTGALYERKSFKYMAITTGYWMVSMAIMGGIICAYS